MSRQVSHCAPVRARKGSACKSPHIHPDDPRCLHMLSYAVICIQMLSDAARCFQMLSYCLICTQMPPDALRLSQILANPFRSSEMSCHGMLFAFVSAWARSLRNVAPSRPLRAVRACKHFACKSTQIRSDASTCFHMLSSAFKYVQMLSNPGRCSQMLSYALRCSQVPPDALVSH